MKIEQISYSSFSLEERLDIRIYGEGGMPLLVLPDQDGKAFNYEWFGMVDSISGFIDSGEVCLFSVDSIDQESFSDVHGNNDYRASRQEKYYRFICEELVPLIHRRLKNNNRIFLTGCSLGASQACLFGLRRPDLFEGFIALSGIYDASYFFGGWMSPVLYDNSPLHFLPNMAKDHPYISIYKNRSFIFCCGQGPYEEDSAYSLKAMEKVFKEKGINGTFDIWGYDVAHHWYWWKKEISYLLPSALLFYHRHYD